MFTEELNAEQFAKKFYHYHEALAPDFNCDSKTRDEAWDEVPANERSRIVAAVRLTLLDVGADESSSHHEHRFPKPVEKEWGC